MALPKIHRLKRNKDIDSVFKEGNAIKGSFLLIKYLNNGLKISRLGFIVPAKIYNTAVARNRIRRLLSEATRSKLSHMNAGYDIIVMIRSRGKEEAVVEEIHKLLLKI